MIRRWASATPTRCVAARSSCQASGRLAGRSSSARRARSTRCDERYGVDVVVVGDLESFAGVDTGIEVAARVGRAGEAHLVPRPRVGVERGAGVARPQAPDVGGRPVMPALAVVGEVLDVLEQPGLGGAVELGVADVVTVVGVGVQSRQRVRATLGRLRACRRSASRRSRRGQPLRRSAPAPGPAGRCLGPAAGRASARRRRPRAGVKNDSAFGSASRASTTPAVTSSHWWAWASTSKPAEAAVVLRGDRLLVRRSERHQRVAPSPGRGRSSRRSSAASRPIPPTSEASSGANAGGPDSRLYFVSPPGRCRMPRRCR